LPCEIEVASSDIKIVLIVFHRAGRIWEKTSEERISEVFR